MSGAMAAFGVAVVAVFVGFILSEMGYRGARLIGVAASIILPAYAVGRVPELLDAVGRISAEGVVGESVALALKVIGIGYIGGICYDTCIDMGYRGVANTVMTVGKIEILAAIMPAVSELLKLAIDML